MNELEAFAVLTSIPNLGAIKIRLLIEHFGSALEALKVSNTDLNALPGFSRVITSWQNWKKDKVWKQDLELVDKYKIQLIPYTHPNFPKALLEIPDHPALLYVQGTLKPQDQHSLAIVGTRHASIYGNEMAESISKQLAANGFTIVSGLARGIDTSAHKGALERGRTLAVIGSGLANLYPPENQSLANSIAQNGALISEFPMMTSPDRQNFPQRNRIVSGMTKGTILIEAPIKSGAMITMDRALQQKKKLFALPGRADCDNFRGNHKLIKNGQALLIENGQDVASHFQELFSIQATPRASPRLDREEQALIDLMPKEEITIDLLATLTPYPIQQINRILMGLVLKKAIKEFPGKIYKKLNV